MSKILVLGDCHFGARNGNSVIYEHQRRFFIDELFPYMKKHKIKTIISLGDLWDVRKFTNHIILHKVKNDIFAYMQRENIKFITLVGNHDLPNRTNVDGNISTLHLKEFDNVEVIDVAVNKTICGVDFLLIPWICDDNREFIKSTIETSDSIFCAGHLELAGFEMQKGVAAHGETDIKQFDKFDLVLSGHYHTRSQKKNILYTGIPFQLTWADYDDQKGFHVFDTSTHDIEFVKTSASLFHRIEYDDSNGVKRMYVNSLKDVYVKVVVINKTDPVSFEKFITNIILENPADLKIVDMVADLSTIEMEDDVDFEDTKTLITNFISQIDTDLDKTELESIMHTLYINALEITI